MNEHGKPIALSGAIVGQEGRLGVFLNYEPRDFLAPRGEPLSGGPVDARGSTRSDLVRVNAKNLEHIREGRTQDFIVDDGLLQLDPSGAGVDVFCEGAKVGQFGAAEKRRGYVDAVRAWGRPLSVTVKAGDRCGRESWEAWVEVDIDVLVKALPTMGSAMVIGSSDLGWACPNRRPPSSTACQRVR